jgi:hypothetical protein
MGTSVVLWAIACILAVCPLEAAPDAETLSVIGDLRASMKLRPLSPSHPDARARHRKARMQERSNSDGIFAQARRLFRRLRWVMIATISYRLIMRTLDRFLPIPEDDETDALDYVDFEKFLYEDTPTPFPGDIAKLPIG